MSITRYSTVLNDFIPTSFSRLADRFFSEPAVRSGGFAYSFVPKVDILEREKSYAILLAVPGMRKEDFKIDLKEHELTVSGERKRPSETKEEYFSLLQTQYGMFSRTFILPDDIDAEKIEAKYEDGILGLVVPKDEKKPVKTAIKVA